MNQSATFSTDVVIIGAGVVGLAIARRFAQAGLEVIVLEQHKLFGSETSSRNSEVIHAGIYYPDNTLKAKLCVAGKHQLYSYCEQKNISHLRLGKLIVASSDAQLETLADLQQQALRNGVDDLQYLDGAQAQQLEPTLHPLAALYSPSTGIIDCHQLMLNYLGDVESAGGAIAYQTRVDRIDAEGSQPTVYTSGDTEATISARWVINSAGLDAVRIAENTRGLPAAAVPQLRYARGAYCSYSGRHPFSHLIYPVPEPGGLGVHLTLDLAGSARFGPDVKWIDGVDYTMDDVDPAKFAQSIRLYFPALDEQRLTPSYCGIRPKIYFENQAYTDFFIAGKAQHGVDGLINLFGIESPGLTSSMAIADHVFALAAP